MRKSVVGVAVAMVATVLVSTGPSEAGFLNLLFGPGIGGMGNYYPPQGSQGYAMAWRFNRQTVNYPTKEAAGTIVIDPRQHYLYYVLGGGKAMRYGVGVGREGFGWHGVVRVGQKAEWPDWTPPPQMIVREKKRGRIIPAHMKGGPKNPLGARALYLYNGSGDTQYRIHGTSEPWTIGQNVSSGCIRLRNDDVIDLYKRAKVGAKVVVL